MQVAVDGIRCQRFLCAKLLVNVGCQYISNCPSPALDDHNNLMCLWLTCSVARNFCMTDFDAILQADNFVRNC